MTDSASAIVSRFFELSLEAGRVNSEHLDEPTEPYFEAVLEFVISHPEFRNEFAKAFMQLAHDPDLGPPELIQYCMHVLGWSDIKQQLLDWLELEKSERIRHVLRKLLMSFDDTWQDADMYARFGGG
jgi:hypothetical protein